MATDRDFGNMLNAKAVTKKPAKKKNYSPWAKMKGSC